MPKKESNINLTITTDENQIPESIYWTAEDGGVSDAPAKAAFLSFCSLPPCKVKLAIPTLSMAAITLSART